MDIFESLYLWQNLHIAYTKILGCNLSLQCIQHTVLTIYRAQPYAKFEHITYVLPYSVQVKHRKKLSLSLVLFTGTSGVTSPAVKFMRIYLTRIDREVRGHSFLRKNHGVL